MTPAERSRRADAAFALLRGDAPDVESQPIARVAFTEAAARRGAAGGLEP